MKYSLELGNLSFAYPYFFSNKVEWVCSILARRADDFLHVVLVERIWEVFAENAVVEGLEQFEVSNFSVLFVTILSDYIFIEKKCAKTVEVV